MSEDTKKPRIVMEVCRDGWTQGLQLGIAALDENGYGDGYRIAGPKYNGSQKRLLSTDLDERDAREIREYLDRAFPSGGVAGELFEVECLRAEVECLRAEVKSLNRCVDEQLETIQEAAVALAERGDELRSLRAELDARPSRVEVLREAEALLDTAKDRFPGPVRAGAEWAVRTVRRMADDAEQGEQGEQEPGSPTPLRWGLDDAELGDDDLVTLWLSGPDRESYVLELEPERAAALRALLTGSADAGRGEAR